MNSNQKNYRSITIILSVFFLYLWTGLESFHHHSEIHKDDSCKVCSLTTDLSNAYIDFKNNKPTFNSHEIPFPIKSTVFIPKKTKFPHTGRAPPSII